MDNRTDIKKELKDLSPALHSIKERETAPEVKEGYFKELGDNILNTVKQEDSYQKKGRIFSFELFQYQNLIPYMSRLSVAAAIVGIIVLSVLGYEETSLENNCSNGIACLTQEEIYQYIHANSQAFEVQEIQEGMKPYLESNSTSIDLQATEALQYIDQHKNMLDVDDTATDIF